MIKKTNNFTFPLLLMGIFLVVASSCKKDHKIGNTPSPNITQTFTDSRDGTTYKYVKIGNQYWMAENLAYLPSVNMVADGSEDAAGSYYYVYGYDGTNVADAKA
ncbi:MAG: FISUMP domain-containing protein, partial [Bacteroidales bacterium]|nr:FISUMP domain-containing protein [Bacteroidales bacterium]